MTTILPETQSGTHALFTTLGRNGRGSSLPQTAPGASFRNLIDGNESGREGTPAGISISFTPKFPDNTHQVEGRTYSFAELGMFGYGRATDGAGSARAQCQPPRDSLDKAIAPSSALPEPSQLPQALTPSAANPHESAAVVSVVASRGAFTALVSPAPEIPALAPGQDLASQPAGSTSSASGPFGPAANIFDMPAQQTVAPAAMRTGASRIGPENIEVMERAAPVLPRELKAAAPSPVNLVVSGAGGKLVVAARTQAASAEEDAKLRKLFDEVAHEFGMDISELHVNGVFAERVNQGGGTHGGRCR